MTLTVQMEAARVLRLLPSRSELFHLAPSVLPEAEGY